MGNESTNEVLGLKSIKEYQKKGMGAVVMDQLKLGWYFDKWWDKLILVGLSLLGLVRIWQWVF